MFENLLKKRPWHKCFPGNFSKSFLQDTSGRQCLVKHKVIEVIGNSKIRNNSGRNGGQ